MRTQPPPASRARWGCMFVGVSPPRSRRKGPCGRVSPPSPPRRLSLVPAPSCGSAQADGLRPAPGPPRGGGEKGKGGGTHGGASPAPLLCPMHKGGGGSSSPPGRGGRASVCGEGRAGTLRGHHPLGGRYPCWGNHPRGGISPVGTSSLGERHLGGQLTPGKQHPRVTITQRRASSLGESHTTTPKRGASPRGLAMPPGAWGAAPRRVS